jgi:hypothetical protein
MKFTNLKIIFIIFTFIFLYSKFSVLLGLE